MREAPTRFEATLYVGNLGYRVTEGELGRAMEASVGPNTVARTCNHRASTYVPNTARLVKSSDKTCIAVVSHTHVRGVILHLQYSLEPFGRAKNGGREER